MKAPSWQHCGCNYNKFRMHVPQLWRKVAMHCYHMRAGKGRSRINDSIIMPTSDSAAHGHILLLQ